MDALPDQSARRDRTDLDEWVDRLYGYAVSLVEDPEAAAAAVRDALLVAAERRADLTDPGRLGPWLYALTRNECARRLQHWPERTEAELTELAGRQGMGAADIAAIVGLGLDEAADRLRVAPDGVAEATQRLAVAPAALRAQLVAGTGPDGADYRAALARRAGSFDTAGFPVPLDQHRITWRAVAWLTAVAVLIALVVLVLMPAEAPTAAPTTAAPAAELAAAAGAGLESAVEPETGASTVPDPATGPAPAETLRPPAGAPATTGRAAPPPSIPSTAGTTGPAPVTNPRPPRGGPDRPASPDSPGGPLLVWTQNLTAPDCPATWTARVHAVPTGSGATAATATWSGAGGDTVRLRRSGAEWTGNLAGLPIGPALTLTVRLTTADGTSTRTEQLQYACR